MSQEPTIIFARGFQAEPDWERFNTCKFRSLTEENYTISTCCQHRQERGFICYKIPLNGVQPNHCNGCPVYEKKEE